MSSAALAPAFRVGQRLNRFRWYGQQAWLTSDATVTNHATLALDALAGELSQLGLSGELVGELTRVVRDTARQFRTWVGSESHMYALESANTLLLEDGLPDAVGFDELVIEARDDFLRSTGFCRLERALGDRLGGWLGNPGLRAMRLGELVDQGLRPPDAFRFLPIPTSLDGSDDYVAGEAAGDGPVLHDPEWHQRLQREWLSLLGDPCPLAHAPVAAAPRLVESYVKRLEEEFAAHAVERPAHSLASEIRVVTNPPWVSFRGRSASFGSLAKPFGVFLLVHQSRSTITRAELAQLAGDPGCPLELNTLDKHVSVVSKVLKTAGLKMECERNVGYRIAALPPQRGKTVRVAKRKSARGK
jgi:hypothetical protein